MSSTTHDAKQFLKWTLVGLCILIAGIALASLQNAILMVIGIVLIVAGLATIVFRGAIWDILHGWIG